MKSILIKLTFSFVLLLGTSSIMAQTINGNSQVGVSTTHTYSYSGSYSSGYRWVVIGGTISGSNTGLSVTVNWSSSAGSGTVQFYPSAFAFNPYDLPVTKYTNPPTPSTPSVSSNTCGNKTVTRGTPPLGITWFWQTSSSGTSMGNANETYAKTSSGYVYLRARRNSTGQWSSARSVYVTVNPIPNTPSTPSVSSNTCGNKTITRGTPPLGITWFWQTSSTGTSMSNSNKDYVKASSGNVYLRARNNSTGCWSSMRTVGVTVNHAPAAPAVSGTSRCGAGNATLVVSGYAFSQFAPFKWYTSPSGGSPIASGVSSITRNVSSTTSYYVSRYDENSLCESGRTQATITVQAPSHTIGSAESHCQTNSYVPLTGAPVAGGTWSINGPSSALVLGNGLDMTELTPGQTYQATYTYSSGACASSNTFKKNFYVEPLSVPGTIGGATVRCGSGASSFTLSGHTGTVDKWESRYKNGTGNWSGWSLITHTNNTLSVNPSLTEWSGGTRTYEIKATVQSGSCAVVSATHQITIDRMSVGGLVSGTTEEFGVASGNLTLSGGTGAVQRWEQSINGGSNWTQIAHTSGVLPYTNVQQSTLYRAVVKSGTCSEAVSTSAEVAILNVPLVDLGVTQNIRPGQSTTLTASSGHSNYEWFKNNVQVQDGTNNQFVVTSPGTYKVTVTSSGGATYTTGDAIISSQLEIEENAVITYNYRIPIDNADLFAHTSDQQNVSVQIFDGLGRPMQQLSMEASPNYEDVVQPIVYDAYGRQAKTYLPYMDGGSSSLYKPNALNDQSNYYQTAYSDTNAYSETRFEASVLNRVLEQGAPGTDWQLGSGHSVATEYGIAGTNEIINWDFESLLSGVEVKYGAGLIYENTITDEDGNLTKEYTNKEGQTILKKSQIDATTWAETYYIYDVYGQLSVVLPPEATDRLATGFFGQSSSTRTAFLNTWAFLYTYDSHNRMTMKKVPGADSVLMVYDQWDRLVLTQDGVQRITNTWLFTKYDVLNRPVMTGLATITGTTQQVRDSVFASTERAESFDGAGINEYTDVTYPSNSSIDNYLTVTYYDNYVWDNSAVAYTNPGGLVQNTEVFGQVTGTLTKTGNGSWIKSASYYDDKYRVIQVHSTNHLGGVDVVTNYYDFIGQLTKSVSSHNDGVNTTDIKRTFEYDHAGRLMKTWHTIGAEDSVLVASNQYNELGELVEKALHHGLQSVDYRYNIRGWLTNINKSDLTPFTGEIDDNDLFGMELFYESADASNDIANPMYHNGNISAMKWSTWNDKEWTSTRERAYRFYYDRLNRLEDAHGDLNTASWNATNDYRGEYSYDKNGNIITLGRRNNKGSHIDSLSYTYTGNRLMSVADAATDTTGFNDGNTSGDDYTYDANGNMVKDLNKGIDSIYYNHLNLPILVDFDSPGDSIEYLYDAAGIKLQQKVWQDDTLRKTTDYIGEFIYETDTSGTRELQLIQHEEGRIVSTGDNYDYQYHLKDHLGNVRMTFSTTPENYTIVETFETGEENGWQDLHRSTNANANTTVGGNEVELLPSGQTGAMLFLSVNKGDTLDLSVNANYETAPSGNTFAQIAYSTLFSTFDNSPFGTGEGSSTVETQFGNALTGPNMAGKSSTNTAPRAFLNYIFFDSEMTYQMAGFQQISTAALGVGVHETISINDIIPEQDGYILMYLSNENQEAVNVHWDDFTVYHGKTNVVSTQDYYPFGLTFNESVRVASTEQRFGFGKKEMQEEWGVIDYGARMYDPAIGRWMVQDPLAEFYQPVSPYNYVLNNPISFVDPDGTKVEDPIKNVIVLVGDDRHNAADIIQSLLDQGNENWHIEFSDDFEDAANDIDAYTTNGGEFELDNLIIGSHGFTGGINADGKVVTSKDVNAINDGLDKSNMRESSSGDMWLYRQNEDLNLSPVMSVAEYDKIQAMKQMSSNVKQDGNVIFTACGACANDNGIALGNALYKAFGGRVNVYLNGDQSAVAQTLRGSGKQEFREGPLTVGPIQNGWTKFSTDGAVRNIGSLIINLKGSSPVQEGN